MNTPRVSLLLLPVLLAGALASSPAPLAQTGTAPTPALERELLLRVVQGWREGTVVLQPGQLPPGLRLELPPGSRVLGTLRDENGAQVYLDLPNGSDLTAALRAAGFEVLPPEPVGGEGGFLSSRPGELTGGLWYRSEPSELLNAMLRTTGGQAQVILQLRAVSPQELEMQRAGHQFSLPPLPQLAPPAGVEVRPQGGGGSSDHRTQSAQMRGASPADLQAHYHAELQRQGYTLLTGAAAPAPGGWWASLHSDAEGSLLSLTFREAGDGGVVQALMAVSR